METCKPTSSLSLLFMIWTNVLVTTNGFAQTGALHAVEEPSNLKELRGVWVTNAEGETYASRASIRQAVERLARANINVVYPTVWHEGLTIYPSPLAKETLGLECDPAFAGRDVLQEWIEEAGEHGIAVIPWFEFGFSACHEGVPHDPLKRKPEWAALGADGTPVTNHGRTTWWNALDPRVQDFLFSLCVEIAAYDVVGIHGDHRFPGLYFEAGYEPATLEMWLKETGRPAPVDPAEESWRTWRADRLTQAFLQLRNRLEQAKPTLLFTLSPGKPARARTEFLQSPREWIDRGLIDWLHPQALRRDAERYERALSEMLELHYPASFKERIFPAMMMQRREYVISTEDLLRCIAWNREHGLRGEVLYSYEGLAANPHLLEALRRGPYARIAELPPRLRLARQSEHAPTKGK